MFAYSLLKFLCRYLHLFFLHAILHYGFMLRVLLFSVLLLKLLYDRKVKQIKANSVVPQGLWCLMLSAILDRKPTADINRKCSSGLPLLSARSSGP